MNNMTVAVSACPSYEERNIKQAVTACVENLGGWEAFIRPGAKVLLKPNLMCAAEPNRAVTTHPAIVGELAFQLMEYGAEVWIGDNPAGEYNHDGLMDIYEVTGMTRISKQLGVKLHPMDREVMRKNISGMLLKSIPVVRALEEVDAVISVAKAKSHAYMTMTGAVKNCFGLVFGFHKSEFHLHMQQLSQFANALLDICICTNPVLSFLDGVVSMEGDGPSNGTPVKTGFVAASANPFALDMALASILRIPCFSVPTIKQSIVRGLCVEDAGMLKVKGERFESLAVRPFRLPVTVDGANYVNTSALDDDFVAEHIKAKPICNEKRCIGCGICKDRCPVKAIRVVTHEDRFIAHMDLDKCIRCFCCHEFCPEAAIRIRRSTLLKKVLKKQVWEEK